MLCYLDSQLKKDFLEDTGPLISGWTKSLLASLKRALLLGHIFVVLAGLLSFSLNGLCQVHQSTSRFNMEGNHNAPRISLQPLPPLTEAKVG